jgi:hypothetical protein
MGGDYHGRRWTVCLLWKEGIKSLYVHHQLSAICGEKAPACSTVFDWAWSFNIDKEPAQKGVSCGHLATLQTSATVQYPH